MANIRKALVTNGVVSTTALFDPDNLPDFAAEWIDCPKEVGKGWRYDGVTFTEPTQADRDAKLEEQVQKIADDITENNERDVAMALATVDLVRAAAAGQITGLTREEVVQEYRDRIVDLLRKRRNLQP